MEGLPLIKPQILNPSLNPSTSHGAYVWFESKVFMLSTAVEDRDSAGLGHLRGHGRPDLPWHIPRQPGPALRVGQMITPAETGRLWHFLNLLESLILSRAAVLTSPIAPNWAQMAMSVAVEKCSTSKDQPFLTPQRIPLQTFTS